MPAATQGSSAKGREPPCFGLIPTFHHGFIAAATERCWTRSIVGDLSSALAYCNAAIQLTPQDASPLDLRLI